MFKRSAVACQCALLQCLMHALASRFCRAPCSSNSYAGGSCSKNSRQHSTKHKMLKLHWRRVGPCSRHVETAHAALCVIQCLFYIARLMLCSELFQQQCTAWLHYTYINHFWSIHTDGLRLTPVCISVRPPNHSTTAAQPADTVQQQSANISGAATTANSSGQVRGPG